MSKRVAIVREKLSKTIKLIYDILKTHLKWFFMVSGNN